MSVHATDVSKSNTKRQSGWGTTVPVLPHRVEWPTIAVAIAIWGGFALVVTQHDRLPTPLVVVLLAVLAAWYGSLQHEVIHGHPTPWRIVNTALAAVPLGLVVPFTAYRDSHLAHHAAPDLTVPGLDPESFYVDAATWERCGPVRRAALRSLRTLAGRVVLGPFVQAATCWRGLIRQAGSPRGAVALATHIAGVVVVMMLVGAAGLSPWVYMLGAAWLGGGLALVRSFVEHRWTAAGTRSAVVEAGPAMSLLFLNNNLHHSHHARPGIAWFRLPAAHRSMGGAAQAAEGAGLYAGYGEVVRRYLFRPFDAPVVRAAPPMASPSPVDASAAAMPQPATAR